MAMPEREGPAWRRDFQSMNKNYSQLLYRRGAMSRGNAIDKRTLRSLRPLWLRECSLRSSCASHKVNDSGTRVVMQWHDGFDEPCDFLSNVHHPACGYSHE